MTQFRKKPVVIEAVQFDDHAARYGWSDLILADNPWLDAAYDPGGSLTNYQGADGKQYIKIRTREGNMRCKVGDWIIRGVKGELYPCKPDIFEATYEPAATPEPTADRGWEVPVKPLEWRDHGPDAFPARFWSAQTPFGRYEIEEETASDSPRYRLEWHSSLITDEDGLDAAKAAAQADYERRIRSALTPTDKG